MGEKFAANPVIGTGSMSVPIATSPGRFGFSPQLSLTYDSGAGNGPFGLGWSLSLPAVTRKTEKGLPRYLDVLESDTFILSDAEDLVPVYRRNADRNWIDSHLDHSRGPDGFWRDSTGRLVIHEYDRDNYRIRRYRPRIEGLFARIERWTGDRGDVHWRSITRDNILTIYGRDENSRVTDSTDPTRIFSWLISETRDDKGNAIIYGYKPEDGAGVDLTRVHERNRGARDDPKRRANRYPKFIRYGNRRPLLDRFLPAAADPTVEWLFEVVFDYGEHDLSAPTWAEYVKDWDVRADPFSSYRAGFEVRTTRLCQRVLMFHHIPSTGGPEGQEGYDGLVRSTDLTYAHEQAGSDPSPNYTVLRAVSHVAHKRLGTGYQKRELPPVEFEYSPVKVQDEVHDIDPASLENLPIGLDGSAYRWTDLHGEAIPGILTEQAGAWYYKPNLTPVTAAPDGSSSVRLAPAQRVALQPSFALSGGQAEFMDLAGDGQPDLVAFDKPLPGLFEHDGNFGWQPFRPFTARLNRDFRDPNLRFIDLNGDGHADVLITEDNAFVWHPSLAEDGFGPAQRVPWAPDEEEGPRLVFADGTQSVYIADLSGDGLTDLVRIRNGEVCYWPNLGYGRFGAKVAMDGAPVFDRPDQFDHRRIRLADIDGTGTTDIIYLNAEGVRLYFNQSGNSWSPPQILNVFPRVDDLVSIVAVDLFGNGTACLVWSSPLPSDGRRQMRYMDLMGGQKPHLLVGTDNNLGAKTEIKYAASTKFYLEDKLAGQPWITRLPFPVHVVERVTVADKWRGTRFSTSYSYHHGYFDGVEREFRGFGRVEQVDAETYGKFRQGNASSPYITDDGTLYQPPVKTVTWYHTGAMLDCERILSQYEREYFPHWFERLIPGAENVLGTFRENVLPEPDIAPGGLTFEERRQAMRACKGMVLRQEVYELDVDALERGEHRPVRLFTTAYHNCHIRRLQPQARNRHGVFLATESEAITYHYELDLRPDSLTPDPRVAHKLNLLVDEFGNALQSVAAVYPRHGSHVDVSLPEGTEPLIASVQGQTHLAYTETRYTDDVDEPDHYRLRVPCEVRTYELTGVEPDDRGETPADPTETRYFTLERLRRFRLSDVHDPAVIWGLPEADVLAVIDLEYHQLSTERLVQRRIVEHVRMLFFDNSLRGPLRLGFLGRFGFPFETYKLALTNNLMAAVFAGRINGVVRGQLDNASRSGYLSSTDLAARFPGIDTTGQYWIRSGIAGFAADAALHFHLPERYTDPFGNVTIVEYDDPLYLIIRSSTDPVGNTQRVLGFDYRVLAPQSLEDINGNISSVAFDLLGLPCAVAAAGKGGSGDSVPGLDDASLDPKLQELAEFFTAREYREELDSQAHAWLGNATGRHVYYLGETVGADGTTIWATHSPCACGIVRERHSDQLRPGERSLLQVAFEYSDGGGNVLVKKIQAEPEEEGGPLRWIASGKTILNNKGKPVKQYEPYFTDHPGFEEPDEVGVATTLYYDAIGRTVRAELPDGSFGRIEFSPWHVTSFDPNDTAYDVDPGRQSEWYRRRTDSSHEEFADFSSPGELRAARLAALHANTPAQVFLDNLGREVISVAHNRVPDTAPRYRNTPLPERPWLYGKYVTFTRLDAEGKPLWIRDARSNRVMQYIFPPVAADASQDPIAGFVPCYDIAGNLLYQSSMDAGERWMLSDAAGQPFYVWDANEHAGDDGRLVREQRRYHTTYDPLRRPLAQHLNIEGSSNDLVIETFEYGEGEVEDRTLNLRGQVCRHRDASGLVTNERFDFKGNLLEVSRRLVSDPTAEIVDWSRSGLLGERSIKVTEYDALNRMTRLYNWHRGQGARVAVYEPSYNRRGLIKAEELTVGATRTAAGYEPLQPGRPGETRRAATHVTAVSAIAYNAKGQRTRVHQGNGTETLYDYDPETFRLRQIFTTRPRTGRRFPSYRSNLRDERVVQQLLYTYDASGNITEVEDQAYMPVFFRNQIVEPRSLYTYDALYRLIEATGRENATAVGPPTQRSGEDPAIDFSNPPSDWALRDYRQRYYYDAVGNFVTMRHIAEGGRWTRHYETALDSNRLVRIRTGGNEVRYAYDTHGSMLNLNGEPNAFRLRWDRRDMIHRADLGNGEAFYQYDAGKQRTRKLVRYTPGETEERTYLGGFERYLRRDSAGELEEIETHHLLLADQRVLLVDDVIRTDDPRGPAILLRYQYADVLGSVALELDGYGGIISYEEYHPYGTSAFRARGAGIRATAKRYRYTGMERDDETGLNYQHARYYNVQLARWISGDPVGISDGLNILSYCNCNPINFTDQEGDTCDPTSSSCLSDVVPSQIEREQQYSSSEGHFGQSLLRENETSDPATTEPSVRRSAAEQAREGVDRAIEELGGSLNPLAWPVAGVRPIVVAAGEAADRMNAAETPAAAALEAAGLAIAIAGTRVLDELTPIESAARIDSLQETVEEHRQRAAPSEGQTTQLISGALSSLTQADWSTGTVGERGEALITRILEERRYTDIVAIQNSSGHGIDIVARNPQGRVRFFEVKSSTTGSAGRLSEAQQDIRTFVFDRLQTMAGDTNAASHVRRRARRLLQAVSYNPRNIRGAVFDVTRIDSLGIRVSARIWRPETTARGVRRTAGISQSTGLRTR